MNQKLITKRLNRAKIVGSILSHFPFIRCVILNGSLTGKNHKPSSDIDILIIAKDGHVFTARYFINFWTIIFGIKRSKNPLKPHAGKFCFNYFLTESFLRIPTGRGDKIDRYCADNYSKSMFIAGDIELFKKYMRTNIKLFEKYGFTNQKSKVKSQNLNSKLKKFSLQNMAEHFFSTRFEKWVKKYQIRNIEKDPRTQKYPELIVFNDKELRFHPPKVGSK